MIKHMTFQKIAGVSLTILFSITMVFHLLVLTSIIDFHLVWGGRLHSKTEMVQFETVSLIVNLLFLIIVALKMNWLRFRFPKVVVTVLLWLMAVVFSLNTLGNLVSLNRLETIVFTPITLVSAVFCVVLALAKPTN